MYLFDLEVRTIKDELGALQILHVVCGQVGTGILGMVACLCPTAFIKFCQCIHLPTRITVPSHEYIIPLRTGTKDGQVKAFPGGIQCDAIRKVGDGRAYHRLVFLAKRSTVILIYKDGLTGFRINTCHFVSTDIPYGITLFEIIHRTGSGTY